MDDLLRVRDLHVRFKTMAGIVSAVNGISFRIRPKSTVALVGESGSGKSVTAQAIMGILPRTAEITSGEILFNDPNGGLTDLASLETDSKGYRAIRGDRISIIFQEPMTSLSPLHTIGDQVGEAVIIHRDVDDATAKELTIEMLRLVGFPNPAEAIRAYPFELSGGLRQRAMIAMALVCRPALLIADEPTTALDVTIQAQILKVIKDLQEQLDMAALLITHDLGVVANLAEEVVVAHHGKLVEAGTAKDIFENPQHPYLVALLKAIPRMGMEQGERLKPIREVASPVLQSAAQAAEVADANADANNDGEPLMSVDHLRKTFTLRSARKWLGREPDATILAVNNVSFDLFKGECLGLVGESGCGKTTVSKLLMRSLQPNSGKIIYRGDEKPVDLAELNLREMEPYRKRIQYVFQDPYSSLDPRMTVGRLVGEPLAIQNVGDEQSRRAEVLNLLKMVGLEPEHMSRYPHSFSGGQRQRIGIARALALRPEILICDEPVSALDVSIQAQVLNLLKDLQNYMGLTYIFISHNLAVVDYMADRIAVMAAGRIVELAPRRLLFSEPKHPYTKALIAAVPVPDPTRPLDLKLLAEDRYSKPESWPAPFNDLEGEPAELVDIGNGHLVRMHGATKTAEQEEKERALIHA